MISERDELRNRISKAIKSGGWGVSFSSPEIADAILAEIERTHVLVPRVDERLSRSGRDYTYLLESKQGKLPRP